MSECPTTDRLRSLLDGQLSESEQVELHQHIDSCERCQQTLEGLVAGKESWDGIARRLGDGDTPVTPALHEAINAAKEMEATVPTVKLPPGILQPAEQADSMGRLAHYEILEEVGSGGMGIVLKAFDTSLRRVVAIKVMAPHLAANAAARRRFVREAQAAAAVAHEHVVAIHAVADQHEPPYLAMQFIEGKTLQERLDKSGPLSVREVLRIGMQTAAGLAAAHAQGLVHRDIKPANILLENGVERVKLTDFGLARAVDDASVTQSGVIAGTPLFMSPEQARGEAVDHRSDLFSLGSVMYAMCVGHAPFRASTTMGVIKRVCDESPRPIRETNPDIPEWLTRIIDKLLAKNPENRFQSAKEVEGLLSQCLAHWQQPQTIPLPSEIASVPTTVAASMSAAAMNSAPPSAFQRHLGGHTLILAALVGLVAFLVAAAFGQIGWQEAAIVACVFALWALILRWIFGASKHAAAPQSDATKPAVSSPQTEGWRLRCTTCGHTRSLASVGGVRIGAASKGKRTLAWCSQCRSLRWTAIEKGDAAPVTVAAPSSTERLPFLSSPMSALPVHPMFGAIFWFGLMMLVISLGLATLIQLNVTSASAAAPLSGPFMLLVGIGSVLLVLMIVVQAISKRDWRATSLGPRPFLPAVVLGTLIVIEWLMFAAWGENGSAAPLRSPAEEFARAIPAITLLVIAAGLLLTGVVVGIRRFIRGLDTTTAGGRLWGTALSGALLAMVCTGLLVITGSLAMLRLSYSEPRPATARLTFQLSGPQVGVTLNGEKMDVSPRGHVDLLLIPGEYVIAHIKQGRPEIRSGETFFGGQHKTVTLNESQADAVQVTGPLVLAYGPGANAPNVAEYVRLQGRWQIVSQERNRVVSSPAQRGQWIEFDRGYMRSDLPDTPRSLPFTSESLVALYAHESPNQIDVLNVGAKGIYRLDGDTLTLAIADAGQPRPTEFVSRPASAVTLTVCRRANSVKEAPAGWEVASKSGWFRGPNGPELTDVFARVVLKLQPSQIERFNNILQEMDREYAALEAQNIERQTNDAGHHVVRIKATPDEIEKLKDRLWSQLDALLNPEQQSIARLNLKLDPPAVKPPIALTELVAPGFFGWGQNGATLELWRIGTWHHWKIQTRGYESSGNARQLPDMYRRFWIEPAAASDIERGAEPTNSGLNEPLAKLLLDEAGVWNLIRSPDGKLFGAIGPNGGGGGSKVKVWETETLAEQFTFTSELTIHDLVFFPDGQRLATCESDHRIRLRDLITGRVLSEFEPLSDPTLALSVNDDGTTMASGGADMLVRVWDLTSNQVRKVLTGATTPVHSVAVSPDGKFIAAGCENGHILVWDANTAERRHLWTHFDHKVTSVAFSPDSQHLAAASWNQLACVFDLGNDFPTKFLKAHTDHVRTIAWSPDGKRVATTSSDGSAIVWDAAKADRLAVFNANVNQCFDAVFLDNNRLATAHRDGFVRLWNVGTVPSATK